MNNREYQIFKKGSKTYFYSSLFFPRPLRDDVFTLYAFVRVADDCVDAVPADAAAFIAFRNNYTQAIGGTPSGISVIDRFCDLSLRKKFNPAWAEAFLDSMQADLTKKEYNTLDETLGYIYGSAEVIGLYMSSLMNLKPNALHAAVMLGRAMQYINFIRDIDEDNGLGRRYLPVAGTPLLSLHTEYARRNHDEFCRFVRIQIAQYRTWQAEAEKGFQYIPFRYRIPVKTASAMYSWTALVIEKNPMIVFDCKVKPSVARIIFTTLRSVFS